MLIQFEDKKVRFKTLDELGMRTKLQEQLLELLARETGLLSCSRPCPPAGCAARWTWRCTPATASSASSSPWKRKNDRYAPVENIPVTTYKAADGQSPADVLPKFFRTEPNVVVVRDLVNAETVDACCAQRSPRTG